MIRMENIWLHPRGNLRFEFSKIVTVLSNFNPIKIYILYPWHVCDIKKTNKNFTLLSVCHYSVLMVSINYWPGRNMSELIVSCSYHVCAYYKLWLSFNFVKTVYDSLRILFNAWFDMQQHKKWIMENKKNK